MRSILSILVLLMFLATNSGYYLASHYCHGNLINTQVNLSGDVSDPCCGDDATCCDFDIKKIKVVDNYLPSASNSLDEQISINLLYPTPPDEFGFIIAPDTKQFWPKGPPPVPLKAKAPGNLRC